MNSSTILALKYSFQACKPPFTSFGVFTFWLNSLCDSFTLDYSIRSLIAISLTLSIMWRFKLDPRTVLEITVFLMFSISSDIFSIPWVPVVSNFSGEANFCSEKATDSSSGCIASLIDVYANSAWGYISITSPSWLLFKLLIHHSILLNTLIYADRMSGYSPSIS